MTSNGTNTQVHARSKDVNSYVVTPPRASGILVSMQTIAARMQWVLDQKLVASARLWSTAAGVAPTHVSTYQRRCRDGVETDIGTATLRALAKAAGVSFAWLATGVGVPGRAVEMDDRYPNRVLAARLVREDGSASESAIASVLADALDSEDDHPALWWADRMRARGHLLRSQALPGVVTEDDAPPRGRNKR